MTEEEKKAIEFLKEKMKNWRKYMPEDKELHAEDIVINLIQKQDTEINKLKEKTTCSYLEIDNEANKWECSNCKTEEYLWEGKPNYCPRCGALIKNFVKLEG